MASNIDATKPAEGETPAVSANLRANFLAAKTEIESLQSVALNQSDIGYDIWLLWGQSNFAGSTSVDSYAEFADANWSQFGNYSNDSATYGKIVVGNDPLKGYDINSTDKTSAASWFARTISRMTPQNRQVLIVQASVSGTGLVANTGGGRWLPGNPGGDLFEMAISAANSAIAAASLIHPSSRFVGFAGIQGESDGDNSITKASYKSAYIDLISYFRSRITGASNALCIIGGMVPEAIANRAGYSSIDAAHREIAAENTLCVYVQGIAGVTSDNLHYNSSNGHRRMGARMARFYPLAASNISPSGVFGSSELILAASSAASSALIGTSVTGSASITLADAAISSSATSGSGGVDGSVSITLADASVSATASHTSASSYDFEADTVSGSPANITQQFGTWVVANSGGSPLTGKYLNQSNSGVSFAACLFDNIAPSSADQTITFRRVQSSQVRDLLVLRPQSSNNGAFPNVKNGYWFHIIGDTGEVRVMAASASSYPAIISQTINLSTNTYFKAICSGSTIDFQYSSNGTSWTSIGSVTDTTHSTTTGAIQYAIGFSGPSMTGIYLDDISLS
jgi:hypothetical protein